MRWNVMEIVGFCLAASHMLFLLLLVSWFGLNKPENWSECKARLHTALRGKPKKAAAPLLPRVKRFRQ